MLKQYIVTAIILAIALTMPSGTLWGQAVFRVEISASVIGLDDQLQVTYTLENGKNITNVRRSAFPHFQVLSGPHLMRSSRNINGVRSHSVSYTYVLKPKETGTFSLPPVVLSAEDGTRYTSPVEEVKVIRGSVAPAVNSSSRRVTDIFEEWEEEKRRQQKQMLQSENIEDNLFLKVETDKQKAYVGEQIMVAYKLYARIPMQMSIAKMPSLNGFWAQEFPLPKELKPQRQVVKGREFEVFTLKKVALFPQQIGQLQLDIAEAEGIAQQLVQIPDPFGMTYTVFPKQVPVRLRSRPLGITVLEHPDGAQKSFQGAVGSFLARVHVQPSTATTDDVVQLTYTLFGSGNIKLISPPQLSLPEGLSTSAPQIRDTINWEGERLSGERSFIYNIIPLESGDYEIPSIEFQFFHPEQGYRTLRTKPISLKIAKGKRSSALNAKGDDPNPTLLRPLWKDSFSTYTVTSHQWIPWVYLFTLLPFIILFILWWSRKRSATEERPGSLKMKANVTARKRLQQAATFLKKNEKEAFYNAINNAVWLYMSDKWNIPIAELSKQKAYQKILSLGWPTELWKLFDQLTESTAQALYTPTSVVQMNEDYARAIDLLSKMELQEKSSSGNMITLLLVLLLSFSGSSSIAQIQDSTLWENGIKAYQQKKFSEAAASFQQLATQKPDAAAAYYNLGNTLYKQKDFLNASLAFRRALHLWPQHKDAEHNFILSRSHLKHWPLEEVSWGKDVWRSIFHFSTWPVWAFLSVLFSSALAIMIYKARVKKIIIPYATQWMMTLLFTALTCLLVFTIVGQMVTPSENEAMIMRDFRLQQSPSDTSGQLLIPAGTLIEILESSGQFYKVETERGETGWTVSGNFERIAPVKK